MPQLIPLTDAQDDRLRDYVALRETSLRRSLEEDEGIFIAEGEKVIRRAHEAGFVPRSLLLAERWLPGLSDVLDVHAEVPVYVVTEELAEAVTGFHVHRGALGSFARRTQWGIEQILAMNRIVVMEDIVDHTNVGAILRSAAGLGWDGALIAPRCADPLYRRSIKVSMGAVFSLPWARLEHHHNAVAMLKEAGFTTVALALREDAVDLRSFAATVSADEKIALLYGNEGHGLSQQWLDDCDVTCVIPMDKGIDSLNVAAACAISCWALGPQP